MIGRLTGNIVSEDPTGSLVLDVKGVGYELVTPVGTTARAAEAMRAQSATAAGAAITLFVHTHMRAESLELFGFATELERRVFRLLIEVPNVGPKSAINLLSALPPTELALAVGSSDVVRLCKIPGVGKKTAERLVLELKEKLPRLSDSPRPTGAARQSEEGQKLLSALTHMGYRANEAERVVKSLAGRVGQEPMAVLLREALTRLTP